MAAPFLNDIAENGKLFLETQDDGARRKIIAAASSLIASLENPGEVMARIGWGEPTKAAALRTAFELGLLKKLSDKPLSSVQLAEGTKADPALVARVMKHLAANDLVKEVGQDSYVATPFSGATQDPTIAGGLTYSFEGMIPTFHGLPEFLAKTDYQNPTNAEDGPVQHGLKTTQPFFGILQSNQRLGSAFNNFMTGYAKMRPRWYDFYPTLEQLGGSDTTKGPLLVDVGGGLGHELIGFHAAQGEQLKGQLVLQDLPSVIQEATDSKLLPSAIQAVPHDFFQPMPEEYKGARAYFMRLILHDWPDSQCQTILDNLRDAMVKGHSKVIINEAVLNDVGAPWQQTSLDWTMMGMLVSRERTESQWRELLAKSGLKITGIWSKEAENVIEAELI
ncbi:unnamed protein product [Clonostachys byssicola]|uniref:O-methyltransferase domain-containing protein n=1 Tax=Clonostachys byssicola TaxID=160290 RepID=A0A9N9UKX8_9HYPO|nr:unnamed protein product [Clonostachys byssicola]